MPTETNAPAADIAILLAMRDRLDAIANECAAAGPPLAGPAEVLWLPLEHFREEVAWLSQTSG